MNDRRKRRTQVELEREKKNVKETKLNW